MSAPTDGVTTRPVDPAGLGEPATPFAPGAAPMLTWVRIADLVIDDAYQRPIRGDGKANIKRIAEGFCWSKFAPLILATMPGGKYSIIDGQHRATAAAMRGLEQLPAQVVIADQWEQAAAFKAINADTTRIRRMSIHGAAVVARDPDALELEEVASTGGAVLLRYPKPHNTIQPGETMSISALAGCLKMYGRDTVITALQCVTQTEANQPGALAGAIIKALCAVLAENQTWRDGGEKLLAAFDEVDLLDELDEARVTRRAKGVSNAEILGDRLRAMLRDHFKSEAA